MYKVLYNDDKNETEIFSRQCQFFNVHQSRILLLNEPRINRKVYRGNKQARKRIPCYLRSSRSVGKVRARRKDYLRSFVLERRGREIGFAQSRVG